MPSCSISLCFVCTVAVLALALHVYLARARPLRSEFPVLRAHGRLAAPPAPLRRRPPRRAQPPRLTAPLPVFIGNLCYVPKRALALP
eukprot:4797051-Pleurochrysis_carterae.AAC.1